MDRRYEPAISTLGIPAYANIPGQTVDGNTISWTDTDDWTQVQESNTYQTVSGCKRFITSCTVPGETYPLMFTCRR